MRLTVVGCSGSIPSPRSPASCYLLEAEGFRLVLDLGSGALGPLQRYFVALAPGRRQIGPFTVTADRVAHPVETFAYRFEYGGRAFVYSGDTGPCPALTELARSADVLLCEAGFPELPDLPPDLHLCGSQAGQHAAAAGAGRLVLTHLDPDEDPAQNLAGAQDAFPGPVTLAAPGQVIDLALAG